MQQLDEELGDVFLVSAAPGTGSKVPEKEITNYGAKSSWKDKFLQECPTTLTRLSLTNRLKRVDNSQKKL